MTETALALSSQGSVQWRKTCLQLVMTHSGQGWDVGTQGAGGWVGGSVPEEVVRKGVLEEEPWSYNLEDA